MAAGKLTSRFGDGNSSVGGSWDRGPFGGGYFWFLSWSPFLLLPSTPQYHSWSIPGCLCETKTTPPIEESARPNRPGDVWVVLVDQGGSGKENRWKGLIVWGPLPYVVQFSVTSIFLNKHPAAFIDQMNQLHFLFWTCMQPNFRTWGLGGLCRPRERERIVDEKSSSSDRANKSPVYTTTLGLMFKTILGFSNTAGSSSICEMGKMYLDCFPTLVAF